MIVARTSLAARQMRLMKTKRTGRMPRQIAPKLIEIEYARKLSAFVVPRVRAAFAQFVAELPAILATAHQQMRLDSAYVTDVGEGKKIRQLIGEARERMQRTVMTSSLEDLASMYASNTAIFQKQQLARQTKAALGIDPFISDKRLAPLVDAFVDANVGYVKGLTDDVASRLEKHALTAVQDGTLYTDLASKLETTFGFSQSRAELIARDQTGKLYGQVNAARQRELGVTHFIWRTSQDERVREDHQALNGQRFAYDDPPEEGLPGEPIQCRCTAEPDFSSILEEASAPEVPAGFDVPEGSKIVEGIPERSKIKENEVYSVPISQIRDRLIAVPGGGSDPVRMQNMRNMFARGQRLPPAQINMLPDGRLFVDSGRHRVLAAMEDNRRVLIQLSTASAAAAEGTVPLRPR